MTVEQIVAKVFNVDADALTDASSRETIRGWDSMGHLNLILELERQFGITLSIEESLRLDSVKTIKDVLTGSRHRAAGRTAALAR